MSRTKTYKEWVVPFQGELPEPHRLVFYELYLLEIHDRHEYRFFLKYEEDLLNAETGEDR